MKVFSLIVGILIWSSISFAAPFVETEKGKIEGISINEGVEAFLGIPYAQNAGGENRWKPPGDVIAWKGAREAKAFGDICMQATPAAFPPWTDPYQPEGKMSEDCLSLNVWRPAQKAGQGRAYPVMIWIHGGGFTTGSGNVPLYNGAALAAQGIIVVTFNYRLGIMGFMQHPDLMKESGAGGEFGLLDQVQAIKWVKKNSRALGGDPDNITIAGQSAGGASVIAMLSTPLTEGLFNRAIIQSGGGITGFSEPATQKENFEAGNFVVANSGRNSVDALRALPAQTVVDKTTGVTMEDGRPVRFYPQMGNHFSSTFSAAGIPVIAGVTRDETSAFDKLTPIDEARYNAYMLAQFGKQADEFISLYQHDSGSFREKLREVRKDIAVASLIARLHEPQAPDHAYLYLFEQTPPGKPENFGSFHSAELPYMFGNLSHDLRPYSDKDETLSALMQQHWLSFIQGPDAAMPAEWQPANEGARGMIYRDGVAKDGILVSDDKLSALLGYHRKGNALKVVLLPGE